MSDTKFERNAGILMPVSSLPSPYGIGTFGKDAYDFVTFVKECNHKYWQVLPLGPTTYGDSPYQSYSALDRKSTRLNSSHPSRSRMPSSA